MTDRVKVVVGAHLILRKNNEVLLARRYNTGFSDGSYNFPCGHMDPDEDVRDTLVRETFEEIGVKVNKSSLKMIGATHWRAKKHSVNFFFECDSWEGEPKNMEPNKCDNIDWFSLEKLPDNLVKQTRLVLNQLVKSNDNFLIEDED